MLVNDIRNAGFGIPESPDINGYLEVVTVTPAGGPNNSDVITLISGFRHIADAGLSAAELTSGQTTLRVSQRDGANRPYVDICYTGSVQFDTAPSPNSMMYLSIDGVTYAEVIAIDPANVDCNFNGVDETAATAVARLILNSDIDKSFPVNINRPTPIYLIEDVTYGIDLQGNVTSDFERAGQIWATMTVANNIDDFQIVEIHEDGDGITDRLRINILARTANEDQTLDPATKPYAGGIILEDGTIKGVPGGQPDQFRRRIWSMEVASRNLWE